jgi:hypothetical protein
MEIVRKSESATLGTINNFKELVSKIYTEEEIKDYRLDEAINDHPLARRPTPIRSKLAYQQILHELKISKKYILPGQMVLFNYQEPKFKEELEYYDRFPLIIALGITRTNDGVIRELGLNLHYFPPHTRAKILIQTYNVFKPYFDKYFNEPSPKPNMFISYKKLKALMKRNAKIAFGIKMYIPVLRGATYVIPTRLFSTSFYTEGKFSKATLQQIFKFWRQFK